MITAILLDGSIISVAYSAKMEAAIRKLYAGKNIAGYIVFDGTEPSR